MKRKQLCALITVALMATTLVMPNNVAPVQAKEKTSVAAASQTNSGLDVKYEPQQSGSKDIQGKITITNNSSNDADLAEGTIKYLFTDEAQNYKKEFRCYHCGLTEPNGYTDLTNKVTAEFKANPDAKGSDDKDMYEIKIGGGILKPGQKVTLSMNFHIEGWNWQAPDFNQKNDYSYVNSKVVTEGFGENNNNYEPSVNLNTEKYTKKSNKEVKASYSNGKLVKIKENGKKLSSSSYVDDESGNVIFKNSYLDGLADGEYTYTFVFEGGKEITKVLKIIDNVENKLKLDVAEIDEVFVGEEAVVPVKLSNFKNGLEPIENYEFTVNYDSSILEFEGVEGAGLTEKYGKLFQVKDATDGSVKIQYLTEKEKQVISEDGVICNLKFKTKKPGKSEVNISDVTLSYFNSVTQDADKYEVDVKNGYVNVVDVFKPKLVVDVEDEVKVNVGEEVLVPVTLSKFKDRLDPIENYEFTVNYDSSKLEFVGVEGAGLTEEYGKLFQVKDATDGSVKIQYLTEKEKQVISEDGVICNLKFKAKAKGEAKVDLSDVTLSYFNSLTGTADKYDAKVDAGSVLIEDIEKEKLVVDVADEVKANVGEEVLVPVTLSKFKDGLDPIENYEFTVKYDSSKLEFVGVEGAGLTEKYGKLFQVKDATDGSVKIQYLTEKEKQVISEDGVICNLKFKTKKPGKSEVNISDVTLSYFNSVTQDADKYDTKVDAGSVLIEDIEKEKLVVDVADEVKANVGEEVLVPVTLSKFKDGLDPIENYEFTVKYDSSKLEFVGVEGAGLTEKYGKLFQVKDATDGSVKIQYLTEKEKQVISEDGVICNLKFKAKAKGEAKVDLSDVTLSYFNSLTSTADKYDVDAKSGSVLVDKIEQGGLAVNIGDVTAVAGETVEIPVKVKVSKDSPVVGASVKLADTDQYTCVDVEDNDDALEEAGASLSYASYIKNSKTALMYVVFDQGSFDGEYLLGTVKVKLNSNLAAGTKVDLKLSEVQFGDSNGTALDYDMNVGSITIKGGTSVTPPKGEDNPPVVEDKPLGVVIGDITAAAGETVKVPVKVKVSKDTPVVGASVKLADTDQYTCVDVEDNDDELEEAGASLSYASYIKNSKTALMYVVFDKGTFDGEYLLGTAEIKLNSNLSSGTKVELKLSEVQFGDSNGTALEYGLNVGNIIIK